jgi:hypothetical protein
MHIPNSPSLDMNLGLNQSQVLVGSGLNHGSEPNVTPLLTPDGPENFNTNVSAPT